VGRPVEIMSLPLRLELLLEKTYQVETEFYSLNNQCPLPQTSANLRRRTHARQEIENRRIEREGLGTPDELFDTDN
jgi:hypothetical protein